MLSDEEKESMRLFDILEHIGVNKEYRNKLQRVSSTYEILYTYFTQQKSNIVLAADLKAYFQQVTTYNIINHWEDARTDMDCIICDETLPVIEDISEAGQQPLSLLIVRELNTPAGYAKLQLVMNGVPCTHIHWPRVSDINIPLKCLTTDSLGRMVLFDIPSIYGVNCGSRWANKPATKFGTIDTVVCFRCKTWPAIAKEWLFRHRLYGWPSQEIIQEIKSLACFVVKKGHPLSSEIDLEWRISMSLQEKKLMFYLTDVQHKCYYALKILNRDVIKLKYLTSYHWKTCLLFVIEENNVNIWQKTRLCHSVKLCIEQMLKWVKRGFCPNYFIHTDNLFDGKLDGRRKLILENTLEHFFTVGYRLDNELCNLLTDNPRSLENDKWSQWLQTRKIEYEISLLDMNLTMSMYSGCISNIHILDKYYNQSNENVATFIHFLWEKIDQIQQDYTVTEHTLDETKSSMSLLIPFIYVRSFQYFVKGNLSGRLKFISVLYAIGLYKDCERFLEREDEQDIKRNPSVCICSITNFDLTQKDENHINTLNSNVCTCISFLPCELPVTPDAMKYEMFRYIGICLQENERPSILSTWNYRAVVDCNVYFFLLKYLIKRKLRKDQESEDARSSILDLLSGTNVRHCDVAYNVLAWTCSSDYLIPIALLFSAFSWIITNSFNPNLLVLNAEMKRTESQYNAAKLHALVLCTTHGSLERRRTFNSAFSVLLLVKKS
ncbi:unnamed protein product [Mytilus edulis]|uniref:Mab-21-like HhH/H2TH-like domain-containing protein n=1 Tax=Mytilus edulis TaxID=6550 RepID=A0A8S3TWC4_MYTED|nr:unnamed protein product [Mytilus edulis]